MQKTEYKITNIHTGEVKQGTARQLSESINVSFAVIRKAYWEGYNINGAWKVEKLESSDEPLDEEFRKEWEETCEPFRELSKKKEERKHGNMAKGN